MMRRTVATVIAGAVAAGALAATPVATTVGAPLRCIPLSGIDHTVVRDDRTIDFFMHGRAIYRNTLPQSCPELGFEGAFGYETSQSVLCNVDIITVLRRADPLRRGASCGLGPFQPVTLAK